MVSLSELEPTFVHYWRPRLTGSYARVSHRHFGTGEHGRGWAMIHTDAMYNQPYNVTSQSIIKKFYTHEKGDRAGLLSVHTLCYITRPGGAGEGWVAEVLMSEARGRGRRPSWRRRPAGGCDAGGGCRGPAPRRPAPSRPQAVGRRSSSHAASLQGVRLQIKKLFICRRSEKMCLNVFLTVCLNGLRKHETYVDI